MEHSFSLFEQYDIDNTVICAIANFMHPTQQTNLRATCRRMRAAIPPPRSMTTTELIYDCAETGYCDLCMDLLEHLPRLADENFGDFALGFDLSILMQNRRILTTPTTAITIKSAFAFALRARQWEIAEKIKKNKNVSSCLEVILLAASGDVGRWKRAFDIEMQPKEDKVSRIPYHTKEEIFGIEGSCNPLVSIQISILRYSLRYAAFFGHADLCDLIFSLCNKDLHKRHFHRILLENSVYGSHQQLARIAYEQIKPCGFANYCIIENAQTREMWEFVDECLRDSLPLQENLRRAISESFTLMIVKSIHRIAKRCARNELRKIIGTIEKIYVSCELGDKSKLAVTHSIAKLLADRDLKSLTLKIYSALVEETEENPNSTINLALKLSEYYDAPIDWSQIFSAEYVDTGVIHLSSIAIAQWIYTCPRMIANIKKKDGFAPNWNIILSEIITFNPVRMIMVNSSCSAIRRLHFGLFGSEVVNYDRLIELF